MALFYLGYYCWEKIIREVNLTMVVKQRKQPSLEFFYDILCPFLRADLDLIMRDWQGTGLLTSQSRSNVRNVAMWKKIMVKTQSHFKNIKKINKTKQNKEEI